MKQRAMLSVLLMFCLILSACAAGPKAQAPSPARRPTAGTQPARAIPAVEPAAWAILQRLEKAGEKYKTIQAEVVYQVEDKTLGDKEVRTGRVAFQRKTKSQGGKFRISFETCRLDDGPRTREKEDYIFDGQYLTVDKYKIKTRTRYQVRQVDALKIGKGPFPVPFGQKAGDVARCLEPTTRKAIKGDPPNSDYIKLVPRRNRKEDMNFRRLEMWVDRKTDLPVKIRTRDHNKKITTVIFKNLKPGSKIRPGLFDVPLPAGFELNEVPLK